MNSADLNICIQFFFEYLCVFFLVNLPTERERKMDLNFHSINIGFNLITDTITRQMCEPNIIL